MLEDITHNFFDIEKSSFDRSAKVKVSNKSTADNGERKDERANGQVARSFGYPAKKSCPISRAADSSLGTEWTTIPWEMTKARRRTKRGDF